FYLRALRQEPHNAYFRSCYLPAAVPENQNDPDSDENMDAETPSAFIAEDDKGKGSVARRSDQPLTASLYLDGIDSFGEWLIYTTTRAQRDLRKARKEDGKKFKIIVKKIQELSRGHFSDDNHKKLTGLNVGVPVYEAKMSRDLRLVYQIHCVSDFGTDVTIRIFGVYTHAQLDSRFWDAMSRTLADTSPEYKKRCLYRNRTTYRRGDNVVLPGEFPASSIENALHQPTQRPSDMSRGQMDEAHALAVLDIWLDEDVAHVFNVTPQEKDIIENPKSCIVIGTYYVQKTTTMLFKMLGIERSWSERHPDEGAKKPRQLFVTQSRVLAEKVEEYYGKLQRSYATAHLSPSQLKDFLTSKATDGPQRQRRLVDADEEVLWRADLPKSYSALEEAHFPMFLTYSQLCQLLQNDFESAQVKEEARQGAPRVHRNAFRSQTGSRHQGSATSAQLDLIIDDKAFLTTYWAHFPDELTTRLNPDIVFSEFIGTLLMAGVIQGSEAALNSETGYLDRMTYCGRNSRSLVQDWARRNVIYDLFLLYRTKKRQLWQRDAADRYIVQALRKEGLPGRSIDFLYVDEAQDNLLVDTYVLNTLCPNTRGMFWAGDTAQTISAGSAFRFSELKAFLYRLARQTPTTTLPSSFSDPTMFHLTANYRSHAGIVDCAAAIVALITRFWPDSIDTLPREIGMTAGPKPIFFWDESAPLLDLSLSDDSGNEIEFGARQCILVRDQDAKERLRTLDRTIGIVLTIPESKGLEFDDVLLYNPFEDSKEDDSQWRVVLNAVTGVPAPTFDETRHAGICRELKSLYVAVTRARMNLWIMDSSTRAYPMRRFLMAADLVDVHQPGTPLPRLAVSSSRDEWAEVAWSLFQKKQYSEAELAFARAKLPKERQVAHAYHLREGVLASRGVTTGHPDTDRLIDVARAFIRCADEAGGVSDRQSYQRIAAQYFALAGKYRDAALAFYAAGLHDDAATHYRKAGMFDEAVGVVRQHRETVSSAVVENVISVSKLQYLRRNEIKKACSLFQSDADALEYMADYGLEAPRAALLEQLGRNSEAAQSQLSEGNVPAGVRLFLLDRHDPQSLSRAAQSLLDRLWSTFSFQPLSSRREPPDELLDLLESFEDVPLDDSQRNEIAIFRAIYAHDFNRLLQLRHGFLHSGNDAAALLLLDFVFAKPLELNTSTPYEIASCFRIFLKYARMLQRLACLPDPCDSLVLQRVFTFLPYDVDYCLVDESSLLGSRVLRLSQRYERSRNGWRGILVLRPQLARHMKEILRQRLCQRVTDQNEVCHNLRHIRPCFLFAISGRCPREDGCPQYHAVAGRHNSADYNILVRIVILQIMIYHTLYATDIPSRQLFEQQRQVLVWLRRLYEALHPPHYMLGSPHLLSVTAVPELDEGRHIITVWIRDFLNELRPGRSEGALHVFLSNLLRATRLAMMFDTRAASAKLHCLPCAFPGVWSLPVLWRDNTYVVQDLLWAMQCRDRGSLERGILFVNHILDQRLPIDISVLCDFMDNLCASLVVATRLKTGRTLHDVILPKSWIARVIPALPALHDKWTRRASEYHVHIERLLLQVYSGRDSDWHLYFENLDLSRPGANRTRNALVARICKNLCLWGYNYHDRSGRLGREIVDQISALGRIGDLVLSPTISPYVYAKTWNDLARAVRASTTGTDLDEMIQLWHGMPTGPIVDCPFPHVQRVFYTKLNQISSLLGVDLPDLQGAPQQSPDARAIPAPASSVSGTHVSSTSIVTTTSTDIDDCERPTSHDEVSDEADQLQAGTPGLTQDELAAGELIAAAFRRYLARIRTEKEALQHARSRVYAQFLAEAQTKHWHTRTSRLLFLAVLPYAYFAIECTKNYLGVTIASTKERLRTVNHVELEAVQSTLDRLVELSQKASQLLVQFQPAASDYEETGMETIKACIRESDNILRGMEEDADLDAKFEWREDVDIALGIVDVS
ncbi:hypothetical protein C8Q77DRAFT_1044775, partial [Trametes polyzona]